MSQKSQIRNPKKFYKYNPEDVVDISEILPEDFELESVQAQDIPREIVPAMSFNNISKRILFI
jgi:hypothetical protein